jgi:hypothetical protein
MMQRRAFFPKALLFLTSGFGIVREKQLEVETIKLDIPSDYKDAWPMMNSDGQVFVMWTEKERSK